MSLKKPLVYNAALSELQAGDSLDIDRGIEVGRIPLFGWSMDENKSWNGWRWKQVASRLFNAVEGLGQFNARLVINVKRDAGVYNCWCRLREGGILLHQFTITNTSWAWLVANITMPVGGDKMFEFSIKSSITMFPDPRPYIYIRFAYIEIWKS